MQIITIENIIALLTLIGLEVVLGVDNIVVLAILTGKLDPAHRKEARIIGLSLAMIMRILLLLSIRWIIQLTEPLFVVFHHAVSGRDLILLAGGLFLIAKGTYEIHEKMEGEDDTTKAGRHVATSFFIAVIQIVVVDLVFSLDSVITAVGMSNHIGIMITAIIVAVFIMMAFTGAVSHLIERHPTIKMLALSFLLLVGIMLVADGIGKHNERGYIYFAMGFSLFVEIINTRLARKVIHHRNVT